MFKKSFIWLLVLCMALVVVPITALAGETTDASSEAQTVAEGDKPNATVSVLDPFVITPKDDYMCWPNGATDVDRPVQIVMNFKAQDTLAEAKASKYGKWVCDFYLTFNGIAAEPLVADDCYLAGNYGTFGWIVIPADGLELENGVAYPVEPEHM